MELTLEQLGLTKEDIQDRVVERAVERLLRSTLADEDGDPISADSAFAESINERIREQIDATIDAIAQRTVLPNVAQYIEKLTLQETTKWGEAKGAPVTFVGYLVGRAEAYLDEQVDHDGKSKSEKDSYNWSGRQTRITFLINSHLQYSINTALVGALKTVNDSIADGIAETVKLQLAKITTSIKAQVKS